MVDPNALSRRLLALTEALSNLEREGASDAGMLAADAVLRAAVERWLQVAVEACVDVATHVIADAGWTPPGTARQSFLVLANHGKIPLTLAEKLGFAAGLRNLLVHDYVAVDLRKLAAIVRTDLGDLREFAKIAATWLEEEE